MTVTYKQVEEGFMICDENGENIHFNRPLMCKTEQRAQEVANIINTSDILEAEVDRLVKSEEPNWKEKWEVAYKARWNYYYEHYDILSHVGDAM